MKNWRILYESLAFGSFCLHILSRAAHTKRVNHVRSNAPQQNGVTAYNERTAESTGVYVEQGYQLMGMLISES